MSNGLKVKKRDGRVQNIDLEKMHIMVDAACEGLAGVSASQLRFNQEFNSMMALHCTDPTDFDP